MKKIISILLVLSMIFTGFTMPVHAEETFAAEAPFNYTCTYDKNLRNLLVGDTLHVEVKVENNTEEDYEHVWAGMGIFEITEDGGMVRLQELIAENTEACVATETGAYISVLKSGQSETVKYECVIPEEWVGKNILLFGAIFQTTNDTVISGDFSNYIFEEIIVDDEGCVIDNEVVRLFGDTRYDTGYVVAEAYKEALGTEKFDAVVVATGKNFADALAGSYLAAEKNAPILLTNGKDENVAELHRYIRKNVAEGGKVYILGGEGAVAASVEKIEGYDVVRLFGDSRYDTNIAILEEAGNAGDSIIVATGKNFADSLSASATRLPILLVKPNATLNDEQKAILENKSNIYIVGGEGTVSESYANELESFGNVTRVYGDSRYDTSIEVAKTFFGDVKSAVVASGKNFPDGLCGGPLAAALKVPLILTADNKTGVADSYLADKEVQAGYVLGGGASLANNSVVNIFDLDNEDDIQEVTKKESGMIKVAVQENAYGSDMWKKVCDAFEKLTGTKVELVIDTDITDNIEASMKNGKYPDVVQLSTGWELTDQFVADNMLTDITDVFSMTVPGENVKVSEKMLGGFTETALTNPYDDGKTYLAPMFYSPCGLFYNAALLEEKGWDLPTTWDEMWELGNKAAKDGIALFTYPTTGYLDAFFYSLLYSAGGPEFFNAATTYEKGIWKTEEAAKCFEIVAKLATYTDPITAEQANYEDFTLNQEMVLANEAIFMPNGTWIVGEMEFSPRVDGFEWGMMAVPAVDEDASSYSYAWIDQTWIPSEAKNIDDAKQFLAFLYSDEACEIFAEAGAIQPVKGLSEKLEGDNKLFFSIYDDGAKAAMGNFAPYENTDKIGTIMEIFFDPINSLVTGDITKDEWVDKINMSNDLFRNNMK